MSEADHVPTKKPNLSETAGSVELLERWSLFDNCGGESRQ